jgi:sucrose-6F-phosphate phosphohydrolase
MVKEFFKSIMTDRVLICTDLDRTLLPNGHSPESKQARPLLKLLVKRHNVFLAYVSGRDKSLLEKAIHEWELPLPDFAIGDVGTSIYLTKNKQWQLIREWHDFICQDWGDFQRKDIASILRDIEPLRLQEESKQNDYKLSYYVSLDVDINSVLNLIGERLDEHPIKYNRIWSIDEVNQTGLLDILPERANKLEAIRFLIEQEHFSFHDTVFSGDSGNDLEVLTSEIQSTLVNNASDEVKRQARIMAAKNGHSNSLYIAKGEFLGMNGNYAAGILEGVAHYFPHTLEWIEDDLAQQQD